MKWLATNRELRKLLRQALDRIIELEDDARRMEIDPDGDCSYCGGAGCEACDARCIPPVAEASLAADRQQPTDATNATYAEGGWPHPCEHPRIEQHGMPGDLYERCLNCGQEWQADVPFPADQEDTDE